MLLNPADLGVSEPTLKTAEALVAAHLGTTTLESRPVIQTGYLEGQLLPLREGPAVSLGTLVFNGQALTVNPLYPGPRLMPWALDLQAYYSRFSLGLGSLGFGWAGYPYSVTYTAGWVEAGAPDALVEAITLTCQHLDTLAGITPGVVSERMGDVANTYAPGATQLGLPPVVAVLLAPFARIRF